MEGPGVGVPLVVVVCDDCVSEEHHGSIDIEEVGAVMVHVDEANVSAIGFCDVHIVYVDVHGLAPDELGEGAGCLGSSAHQLFIFFFFFCFLQIEIVRLVQFLFYL